MSQIASFRTPYADAETPHQMINDCRAVGAQLPIPTPRETQRGSHSAHRPTTWFVSDRAATIAGGLHLHLD
ncbi:hypothetical protein ASG90_06310 [Nocardioides sp. Soil797]|nr:hypothetical protein ASG90_06310 [Nocardioides sp. Soil797]